MSGSVSVSRSTRGVRMTAAEANASSGTGLSAAELGVLDGVTPGTATASKAVVLDSSKGIATVTTATITTLTATDIAGGPTFSAGIGAGGGFTVSPRCVRVGATFEGSNSVAPVVTETYIGEVFVPCNMSVTGIALFNGSAAAGNVHLGLANSSGALVTGCETASTAMSGTDSYQRVPFSGGAVAVKGPATYYVLAQFSNTGARYNTVYAGAFGASKKTGEVYGTFTTVTPPTTFTSQVCAQATLY